MATTHHFQPTHYYTTLGTHEAVLRIASGDTVITTTVDARGGDASGQQATPPGNPMTGPFYVEGAEPGDTLVVVLDKLTPNRPHGWTRKVWRPMWSIPIILLNCPSRRRGRNWQRGA